MQRNINKEIRHYEEQLILGLTLRQLLCSAAAIGVAVLAYLLLLPSLGQETASWVCILAAAPVAVAGFFSYDGMTFEQFLWAVFSSTVLLDGPRVWKAENRYEQVRKGRETKPHEQCTTEHGFVQKGVCRTGDL